jgi:hypothetical protein
VKQFRSMAALLLLALWLPATSHCLMESAGLMPTALSCADECSPGAPAGQDTEDLCASLESASYKAGDDDALTIVPSFLPALALVFVLPESFSGATTSPLFPTVSPPALRVTWQFVQRAALPVRSPSLPV